MKKWFNNLKIASKLITGFLLVAALGVAIGVVGIINLITITDRELGTMSRYL